MRIVLASVLKPVTDPRLLARLGRTLAELPAAEVHIVAHIAADAPTARRDVACPNVWLHPVFDFPRLSLARARAGQMLLKQLRAFRPQVVVVGAAELLPAGLRWQRQTGGHLVYDVRENYALNVRTQGVFPPAIAGLLAARIERLEAAAAPHLSGVLLAERVYAEQLPWLAQCRRVEIIENKYQPTSPIPDPPLRGPLTPDRPLRLLLSGTLSPLYGTFDAIALVEKLREQTPAMVSELHVVGHAPQAEDARALRRLAAEWPWLKLVGIEPPVPHATIIEAVRRADIGLLPYRPHPSLDGCIPTKFWEYQAESLPLVQRTAQGWLAVAPALPAIHHTASNVSPADSPDYPTFFSAVSQLLELGLPTAVSSPPPDAFWDLEAPRLRTFFADLRQP